jgi:serine/threonine-protein kinase
VGGNRNLGTDPTMSNDPLASKAPSTPPSAHGDLEAGTMVGEYKVDGLLGAGGMGKVYSATHPLIGKRAAIKVLHPALSVDPDAVERFVQEARAVNQIGHPNIVDIFAFGALPDGRCYFVMEQLRGESLATRIDRAALPLEDVLSILDTIAIALDAAHRKGIVHRDLKPDNVFLAEVEGARPAVKLLDFGIAKLTGGDTGTKRTQTGNVMGTPAYISPEQARGQGVDHRTDLYAFGAVAYELLTGELVFPATNAADMLAQHLFTAPPSVRARRPEIDPELDALITSLLAKDANDRPTLEQAREQLRACSARMHQRMALHEGGHTEPVIMVTGPLTAPAMAAVERRSSRLLLAASVGVVAVVAIVVFVLLRKGPPAAATTSTAPSAATTTNAATGTAKTATTSTTNTAPTPATNTAATPATNADTTPATNAGTTSSTNATTATTAATTNADTATKPATTTNTATRPTTTATTPMKPTTKPAQPATRPKKPGPAGTPGPVDDPDAPM